MVRFELIVVIEFSKLFFVCAYDHNELLLQNLMSNFELGSELDYNFVLYSRSLPHDFETRFDAVQLLGPQNIKVLAPLPFRHIQPISIILIHALRDRKTLYNVYDISP